MSDDAKARLARVIANARSPDTLLVWPFDRCPLGFVRQRYAGASWVVAAFVDREGHGERLAMRLAVDDNEEGKAFFTEEVAPGLTVYVVGGCRAKV
jgi:hypothetical protein